MAFTESIEKQAANISYNGTSWTGLAGGNAVTLENASNILNGQSTFGTVLGTTRGKPLINGAGTGKVVLAQGVDFQYNQRLDASTTEDATDGFGTTAGGIVDTGISGALASGKYIRAVENTKNIKDATGLNLKVYAKDLGMPKDSPTYNIANVDPITGKLVLPRPYYYNGLLNATEVNNPNIRGTNDPSTSYAFSGYSSEGAESVKFSKGWYVYTSTNTNASQSGDGWRKLYTGIPAIPPAFNVSTKGTVSFWANTNVNSVGDSSFKTGAGYAYTGFVISEVAGIKILIFRYVDCYGSVTSKLYLYINNSIVATSASDISNGTTYHIYAVWDQAKGLTGGKSVRVFLDNVEAVSTTNDLPDALTNTSPYFYLYTYASASGMFAAWGWGNAKSSLSNCKYFTHVVSEDPAWEYNSGTGRELAMHSIYGATSSYEYLPKLVSPGGLGYFYLTDSTSPATLAGNLSNITATLESASNISYATGTFGTVNNLANSSFSNLISETHFKYDKRLDASTTQDSTNGFGAIAGGMIDTGVSGSLASNKYIRIVENALNMKDGAGLNLQVYAKAIANPAVMSPPATQCYIDPFSGKFILPKPVYWSKMETLTNFYTGEIGTLAPVGTDFDVILQQTGKFGNALNFSSSGGTLTAQYKFNNSYNMVLTSGTASWWTTFSKGSEATYAASETLKFSSNTYVEISADNSIGQLCKIYVNGLLTQSVGCTWGLNSWTHFYVIWDQTGNIKVYRNAVLIAEDTTAFTASEFILQLYSKCSIGYWVGVPWLDNFKLWNHVVVDDPTWEYNSGSGRESALHYIYGATNGYIPVLTTPNSGVGYYKAGASGNNATITLTDIGS